MLTGHIKFFDFPVQRIEVVTYLLSSPFAKKSWTRKTLKRNNGVLWGKKRVAGGLMSADEQGRCFFEIKKCAEE